MSEVAHDIRVHIEHTRNTPASSLSAQATSQNRETMLLLLQRSYKNLLDKSLQETAWIELGLHERAGAVQNTSNLILRQVTQPDRPLPPGTSLIEVFQQANQELLILGAPGSGKSTLLYQLGRDLLNEATQQENSPLPVLFPLSSWAQKRLPLGEWMIDQLTSALYRIPRKQSEQWIRQEPILPLLDGLDEMEEAARPACITAINAYQREHPLRPLVACCRSEEYIAATRMNQGEGRLLLQNAVEVLVLSPTQLEEAVRQAGNSIAALRAELKQNEALRELARTPLWLNILLLTFKDTPIRALPRQRTTLQHAVFERYVQRQIEEKGNDRRYPPNQTTHWLSFLARQMRTHNHTAFAVEFLQPDWLTKHVRLGYHWGVGLLIGLLITLLVTFLADTLTDILLALFLLQLLKMNLLPLATLLFGLNLKLLLGLLITLLSGLKNRITLAEKLTLPWKEHPSRPFFRLLVAFLVAFLVALFSGLISGPFLGLFSVTHYSRTFWEEKGGREMDFLKHLAHI